MARIENLKTPTNAQAQDSSENLEAQLQERRSERERLRTSLLAEYRKSPKDQQRINSLRAEIVACDTKIAEIENRQNACAPDQHDKETYKPYLLKLDATTKRIEAQNDELRKLLALRKKKNKTTREQEEMKALNNKAKSLLRNLLPLPSDNDGVRGPIENLEIALGTEAFATPRDKFFEEMGTARGTAHLRRLKIQLH